MVVNRQNFDQMVMTQPQLISRLTITLADRLWAMYRQLDNSALQKPIYKIVDMLALQLEKARVFTGQYQTDISVSDLMNMCVIPEKLKPSIIYQIQSEASIRENNGKIFIPNCQELLKQASFFRKKNAKEMQANT